MDISDETTNTDRSKSIKRHVILGYIYKAFSVGANFMLFPLTINYLDKTQYGIWVTLLSIMTWINFFDVGLGLGMRNKVAEALSFNDSKSAQSYISTGYIVIFCIACLLMLGITVFMPFINFNKLFNTDYIKNNELCSLVILSASFVVGNFVLSLINQIFYAHQKASLAGLLQLVSNCLSLIFVYLLITFTKPSLIYFALSYGCATFISYLAFTIFFFYNNQEIIPQLRYFDISKIKDIGNLGISFFVLQIACLILFASSNILITQLLGPEHVQAYDVAFKIFSLITMAYTILVTPLWSAYTDAYSKNDIAWIKGIIKKLNILMIPICIVTFCVAKFSAQITRLWLGIDIEFPEYLIELMGVYVVVFTWSNIYAYFLNGISKVKLQTYCAVLGAILDIPLTIYFVKYLGMGSTGIILGIICVSLPTAIIIPIQVYYLLRVKG